MSKQNIISKIQTLIKEKYLDKFIDLNKLELFSFEELSYILKFLETNNKNYLIKYLKNKQLEFKAAIEEKKIKNKMNTINEEEKNDILAESKNIDNISLNY